MDRELTTHRERAASQVLKNIIKFVIERRNDPGFTANEVYELSDMCEEFTHEVVEAAAEKGRGQIQS